MTSTVQPSDQHYDAALASLKKSLAQFAGCSDEEKARLTDETAQLIEMQQKLETGRVDIVVFGEISTGKSALINALVGKEIAPVSVRGGHTRRVGSVSWDDLGYAIPGFASSGVVLSDTPGINEVDGEQRARLAQEASQRADLILFVTDSDLNNREFEAIAELAQGNKPMILVVNKCDLYSPEQRRRVLEVLRDERLPQLISPEDIVETAADPMEREYIIESADGSERTEMRKPRPRIDELKERILAILEREGKALLALNGALFAADASDKLAALKIRLRNETANRVIWSYASIKAVAVALNPIPVIDIAGGAASDVTMIMHLAKIYGIEMTREKALDLIKSIIKSAGGMVAIEAATHLAATIFKGLTLGVGTVVTALPQGAVGGYGSYIVGKAAKFYFEQGGYWGEEPSKRRIEARSWTSSKSRFRNAFD